MLTTLQNIKTIGEEILMNKDDDLSTALRLMEVKLSQRLFSPSAKKLQYH